MFRRKNELFYGIFICIKGETERQSSEFFFKGRIGFLNITVNTKGILHKRKRNLK